jgi:rare lipoprotein A (peptidoglycan hydrolase)
MKRLLVIGAVAVIVAFIITMLIPDRSEATVISRGTAVASWYGPGLYGGTTADGTPFNESSVGVAHRTFPFDTRCTFSYGSRRMTMVRVFDRGPHVDGRTFDLAGAVARKLRFSGVHAIRYVCWRPTIRPRS